MRTIVHEPYSHLDIWPHLAYAQSIGHAGGSELDSAARLRYSSRAASAPGPAEVPAPTFVNLCSSH